MLYEPHHYQYKYTSSGRGEHSRFTAKARGELDCDGMYSSFEIRGSIASEGSVIIIGTIVNKEIYKYSALVS